MNKCDRIKSFRQNIFIVDQLLQPQTKLEAKKILINASQRSAWNTF